MTDRRARQLACNNSNEGNKNKLRKIGLNSTKGISLNAVPKRVCKAEAGVIGDAQNGKHHGRSQKTHFLCGPRMHKKDKNTGNYRINMFNA